MASAPISSPLAISTERCMVFSSSRTLPCQRLVVSTRRASVEIGRTVADVERDLILETLKHCLGNRTHAANILGISIRTLRNKLNEYADGGLPIPPPGAGDYQRAAPVG